MTSTVQLAIEYRTIAMGRHLVPPIRCHRQTAPAAMAAPRAKKSPVVLKSDESHLEMRRYPKRMPTGSTIAPPANAAR